MFVCGTNVYVLTNNIHTMINQMNSKKTAPLYFFA